MIPARPGTLGFVISGRVTRADYRDVLLPPVRAAIANGEQIRVLAVIDQFEGQTPALSWRNSGRLRSSVAASARSTLASPS